MKLELKIPAVELWSPENPRLYHVRICYGDDEVLQLALFLRDQRAAEAVAQRLRTAVGPDSGPGHLAAAVGTPYVTLFGPTSPQRTAPYGCEHLVVLAELDCMPCYQKRCPEQTKLCMHNISADAVLEKLARAKIRNREIID